MGAAMKKQLNRNKIETMSAIVPPSHYSNKTPSRRGSTRSSSRSSRSSTSRRSHIVAPNKLPQDLRFKNQAFLQVPKFEYEDPRKAIEEFRSITPIMEITDQEDRCEINEMWKRILDNTNMKSSRSRSTC